MADGSPRPRLINVYWGIFTWFPSGCVEWGEWNAPEQTALGLSQLAAVVTPPAASVVPYDGSKATRTWWWKTKNVQQVQSTWPFQRFLLY